MIHISSCYSSWMLLLFVTKRIKRLFWKNCGFFFCVCCARYYFKKITDPKNQIISFLFCRPTEPIFFAVLQKFQYSCQNQHFVNTSKNFLKCRNETFPRVHYFTWKLKLISNILWMIVDENNFFLLTSPRLLQTQFFDNFGNSKTFHSFNIKLEQLSRKKVLKTWFSWKMFFRSFHWGQNLVLKGFQICFRTLSEKIK